MLTPIQVKQEYGALFSACEQISDSILRFTRTEGREPFAIYYVDLSDGIPTTSETLTKYLDEIIGPRYFTSPASLQWNTYLYFVLSSTRLRDPNLQEPIQTIQSDKTYARKFVVSDERFGASLYPPLIQPTSGNLGINVLAKWTDILNQAGLEKSIFTKDSWPQRLAQIDSSMARPSTGRSSSVQKHQLGQEPFIRSLQLTKFRSFPIQREFRFGSVNLIRGVNGSGKTSLLEAVELLYCGKHKRNPQPASAYELDATFENGRTEKATERRKGSTFRDRNLDWYGQPELKTSDLYQSFSQFNFFNADAAVSLASAKAGEEIVDDLSKLLVGPDASKTWDDIGRLSDGVATELRSLRREEKVEKTDLTNLDSRLLEVRAVRQESDTIYEQLRAMTSRLGWAPTAESKEALASELVASLSELASVVQTAVNLTWASPPVSIQTLTDYGATSTNVANSVATDLRRLVEIRRARSTREEAIKRDRESVEQISKAMHLLEAGVGDHETSREKLENELSSHLALTLGHRSMNLNALPVVEFESELASYVGKANSMRREAEELLSSARRAYENFTTAKNESANLAQQLRLVAAKLIELGRPDQCPLCHTQFGPGQLAQYINSGVDENLESLARSLSDKVRSCEVEGNTAKSLSDTAAWLALFCRRAGLPANASVRDALGAANRAIATLAEIQEKLDSINTTIDSLRSQGLSTAELERVTFRLQELGYPQAVSSTKMASELMGFINDNLTTLLMTQQTEQSTEQGLQRDVEQKLSLVEANMDDIQKTFSRLRERISTTERVRSKIAEFSTRFPWPKERPLSELLIETDSIRRVASELQSSITRESQARVSYEGLAKEKQLHQQKLVALQLRLKKWEDADSALNQIKEKYSLTSAIENALARNRQSIEAIFLHIHAPAEFRGLGSSYTTLTRTNDGGQASLTEISSGQRAAFALSVFLAQNAQLTLAPPIILMDDPIAHVDDLNSLSFLDYLREIALTNKRQIFFATADEKIAALFERKFDFLGSGRFRQFDLQRGSAAY